MLSLRNISRMTVHVGCCGCHLLSAPACSCRSSLTQPLSLSHAVAGAVKEFRGRPRTTDDAQMHVLGEIVGATGFGGR